MGQHDAQVHPRRRELWADLHRPAQESLRLGEGLLAAAAAEEVAEVVQRVLVRRVEAERAAVEGRGGGGLAVVGL